jgi:hypothetical protein
VEYMRVARMPRPDLPSKYLSLMSMNHIVDLQFDIASLTNNLKVHNHVSHSVIMILHSSKARRCRKRRKQNLPYVIKRAGISLLNCAQTP